MTIFGTKVFYFLIIDFSSMTHNYFKSNLRDSSWVLVNSMISRNLVNSEYNNRVKECNIGLNNIFVENQFKTIEYSSVLQSKYVYFGYQHVNSLFEKII